MSEQRGFTLLLTILILGAILLSVVALSSIFLNEMRSSRDIANSAKAFYAAESGVEEALYRIIQNSEEEEQTIYYNFADNYKYKVEISQSDNGYTITSTGEYHGLTRQLRITL